MRQHGDDLCMSRGHIRTYCGVFRLSGPCRNFNAGCRKRRIGRFVIDFRHLVFLVYLISEFEEICPEPRPSGPNNPQNPDTPTATSPDSGGNTSTTPAGGNTSTSSDPPTTTATSPTNSETGEAVAGNSALNLHVEPILLFSTLIGMVMGRFL